MPFTKFFFYNELKNIDLLKKLDPMCEHRNGNVLVSNYNEETGRLLLGNNVVLHGKVVTFNHSLSAMIDKINGMHTELSIEGKSCCEISKILVDQGVYGSCEAYIIH